MVSVNEIGIKDLNEKKENDEKFDFLGPEQILLLLSRQIDNENLEDSIPNNYKEAWESRFADEWKIAMCAELKALEVNNTWSISPNLNSGKIGSTRWVYTVK